MKTTTKTAAALMSAAMALTCASCGLLPIGGAKTEDIVDAADSFAKALTSCDAGKIAKLTSDSDAAEDLEELFGSEEYTDEQKAIADAVADTLAYEIDEESVKIDKDEASVEVTFTMVDYEAVLEGEFADVSEAVDAIKDCDDTCEVEITFEFESDDDEWLISNLSDKSYGKLYGFYGLDVTFTPPVIDLFDYSSISGDYNYIYLTATFSEDISAYADGFTFDVYLDGDLYYGDMTPEVVDEYLWCDLTIDGPLDSGTYTITLYYDGEAITSESIDIDNTNSGWSSGSGSGYGTDIPDISGDDYACYADCTSAFKDMLDEEGFDIDFTGTIGLNLELTLSDDGEYLLTVDSDTFGADLIDFFTENKDLLMMAFLGVTSKADLEEYADSLGYDTYAVLEETMIQACVSEYSNNFVDLYDYGTYEISGDTIYFSSANYSGFEGTIDGDTISIDTGDTSLNGGDPMEFVYED